MRKSWRRLVVSNMAKIKTTELGRFNAMCREKGVSYGKGVAMGLQLPSPKSNAGKYGRMIKKSGRIWRNSGPFDCVKFAELYNKGYNTSKISREMGVPYRILYDRMQTLCIEGNMSQNGTMIDNPEITPEELYQRAKIVGMPVIELQTMCEESEWDKNA